MFSYCKNLLSEPRVDRSREIESILKNIPNKVTKEKNKSLMRPITYVEVDQSPRDTPLSKAPGPDGFTFDFFHHCWRVIHEYVWEII